jgi:hypothetical protein
MAIINFVKNLFSLLHLCYKQIMIMKRKKNRRRKKMIIKINLVCLHLKFNFLYISLLLATLISAVGINAKPKIIDLTKQFGTAETLTEARVNCPLDEKVCYTNHFSLFFIRFFIFRIYIYIIF